MSGKSEIVINFRYFKPGIVYEIFLVAIPNFLSDSLWCISMMFFNRILIEQLGEIGILLYSTATRIEALMISPQRAFDRALVSVCGHLYGAERFDELKDLYVYVLKLTIVIALVTSVAFFFVRDYGYALFSVTGAETSIFYIALAGIIILPFNEITVISEKMLDGMGKSYISFVLTIGIIIYEIALVNLLSPIFTSGVCVLLGIVIGEITFGSIFLILLNRIFKNHGKVGIVNVSKN